MKINKLIIISALAALVLAGCSKSDKGAENTAAQNKQTEVYQMQEGDTQVSGEVVSIIGNEVTLALGEVTEKAAPADGMPESGGGDEGDVPSENERPGRGKGGDFPSGSFPEGGFTGGEMPDPSSFDKDKSGSEQFGNKQRGGGASIEKSGDTAAYIIPVGMTVGGLSGRSSDYSGISEGDILTLIIDSEGTVKSAEVR